MPQQILMIEDDAAIRNAINRISFGDNFEVRFQSLSEALQGGEQYAVVITDDSALLTPGDRLPLTVLNETYLCPVILTSSSESKRLESFAMQNGASGVLFKPYDLAEIRRLVWTLAGVSGNLENSPTPQLAESGNTSFSAVSVGGKIADEKVFDDLFTEMERRQPLPDGLDSFDVVERSLVKRALVACDGNQSRAARFLGITRNTLRKRIRKYGFGSLITGETIDDEA